MKNFSLLALAAASLLATAAHADEADGSQHVLQAQSTRPAAEVRAEARNPIRISEGSTGVMTPAASDMSREAVKAQAVSAVRDGQTSRGESGLM
ncbi:hypothetical protein [Ramlibacter tataouinensis]|uniref:DUF4148 domain-containing protein n=1 Tax=Ramlibacter tataouinensis (strain ATCC BAA-407 / DSM 14655 / LMG 21543 / TTB310) TaxID=365046 RepID=F5Y1R2_RAMTT|nr:hypothetical protein [Ramlibacter tataouinensis]AEG92313.1 hypothetical protein Rta_12280 [Ramlibacter tataouinensis TTB310]